jgi:hypothetical protein
MEPRTPQFGEADEQVKTKNAAELLAQRTIDFSICTMVTNREQYEEMLSSFARNGFHAPNCEYLHVDNSRQNQLDGYAAMNVFLRAARGRYVIICHQDVVLMEDGYAELSARLAELERIDTRWGLAGNAGGKYLAGMDDLARSITDPHGVNQRFGPLPHRVTALDENFLVVKANANLAASSDLAGFHCYAMDLAIIADVLGFRSYVIDFHLHHKSAGKVADRRSLRPGEVHYENARAALKSKYAERFAPRWVSSPTTEVLLWPRLGLHAGYNIRTLASECWRAAMNAIRAFLRRGH